MKKYNYDNVNYCVMFRLTLFGLGFCQPKKTGGGGGKMPPGPNFSISSQKRMKLGKVILWLEIFTN